jgi:hypothetical protein
MGIIYLTPHAPKCSPESAEGNAPEAGAPDAKEIANIIYAALQEQSPAACVSGDPRDGEDSGIDGIFDLCAVGQLLIDRLHLGSAPEKPE